MVSAAAGLLVVVYLLNVLLNESIRATLRMVVG
jgi:hypothetical protein